MVAEYGMSDKVGPLSFGRDDPGAFFGGQAAKMSGHTAEIVDEEVSRLVNEAHERATEILKKKRDLLDKLSQLLIATEVIEGDDLRAYALGAAPIPDPATARNGKAAAAVAIAPPAPGASPAAAAETDGPVGVVRPSAPPMPRLD
jgi:cell division protease FtsH